MHYLVYVSTATTALTEEELYRSLHKWCANNVRLGVTGVLLYSEGNVLQVLEGDADTLHALFTLISADPRHRGVSKLADGPIKERAFADWSMLFRTVPPSDFKRFTQQLNAGPGHTARLALLMEDFMEQAPEAGAGLSY